MNEFLQAIIEEMNDDGGSCGLTGIVETPTGQRDARTGLFDHVYVDQRTGSCGDDYYGDIYIPIEHGKYLKCWYVC